MKTIRNNYFSKLPAFLFAGCSVLLWGSVLSSTGTSNTLVWHWQNWVFSSNLYRFKLYCLCFPFKHSISAWSSSVGFAGILTAVVWIGWPLSFFFYQVHSYLQQIKKTKAKPSLSRELRGFWTTAGCKWICSLLLNFWFCLWCGFEIV